MSARTPIPTPTETLVLMSSARRCALCFGLNGDVNRKKGQIAHIDQNPSNAEQSNLVFLCVDHHDEYDSKTSQVKGITEAELRVYKERLIAAIASGAHLRPTARQSDASAKADAIRGHDERLFRQADDLLTEKFLREILDLLQSDDSYRTSSVQRLDGFRSFFSETGNQFIDEDLSGKLHTLVQNIDSLLLFLAKHFFVYPSGQQVEDLRFCLYPELNVDRCGYVTPELMARYDKFQVELDQTIEAVRTAYSEYRLTVKRHLYI